MSLRVRLLAAFAVPIALLLATVGLVAVQQRMVQQLVLAAEAREAAHRAEELVGQVSVSDAADGAQQEVIWSALGMAVAEAGSRAADLGLDARLTDRLGGAWRELEVVWIEHQRARDEVTVLYLEESLAQLSEALSVVSVSVRDGLVLAFERERTLGDLPLQFGVAIGFAAALLAVLFAWWFARGIAAPLRELVDATDRVARGDLHVDVVRTGLPEIDRLGSSFRSMAEGLSVVVAQIGASRGSVGTTAEAIREAVAAATEQADRQAQTVQQAYRAVEEMTQSIATVAESARELSDHAQAGSNSSAETERVAGATAASMVQLQEEIEAAATSVSQLRTSMGSVAEQSRALDHAADGTTHSLLQIRESIASIEDSAGESSSLARDTSQGAAAGLHAMGEASAGMKGIREAFVRIDASVKALSEGNRSIRKIVELIATIADQTQLLSLNASIIAAQAGERGRAFGVVADEVSTLAERATQAVRSVGERIEEISSGIESSVSAAREGSERVETGSALVHEAAQQLSEMAQRARASETRADEIVRAVGDGRVAIEAVAQEAQRASAVAAELGVATAQQQATGGAMLETVEKIRTLGADTRAAAESQRAESLQLAAAAASVAEQTEEIRKATGEQHDRAREFELALGVFRRSASEWRDRVGGLGDVTARLLDDSAELGTHVERFSAVGDVASEASGGSGGAELDPSGRSQDASSQEDSSR